MKRTRRLRLLLMGPASFLLAACGDDAEQAGVYDSVDECVKGGIYTETACRSALDNARGQHLQAAPRFASAFECERDFGPGRCESYAISRPVPPQGSETAAASTSSIWLPAMAGFLVGQALGGGQSWRGEPLYRRAEPPPPQQQQSSSSSGGGWRYSSNVRLDDWYRTSDGGTVSNRTGSTTVNRGSPGSSTYSYDWSGGKSTTVSRGGFGSRASSVGASSGS